MAHVPRRYRVARAAEAERRLLTMLTPGVSSGDILAEWERPYAEALVRKREQYAPAFEQLFRLAAEAV